MIRDVRPDPDLDFLTIPGPLKGPKKSQPPLEGKIFIVHPFNWAASLKNYEQYFMRNKQKIIISRRLEDIDENAHPDPLIRCGSDVPDHYQNLTDSQHWFKVATCGKFNYPGQICLCVIRISCKTRKINVQYAFQNNQ
jgi:hypothetical protein